jgi:hypothetical protein
MDIGTRATLIYVLVTFVGFVAAIFPRLLGSSYLLDLTSWNVPKLIFLFGSIICILGFHEVCHCLYCQIFGIKIVGILAGIKGIGIEVEEPYGPRVRLSSLASIPVIAAASTILHLPLWILLFNTGLALIFCSNDIRNSFLVKLIPNA